MILRSSMTSDEFRLKSDYAPKGSQPKAIAELTEGVKSGKQFQTLLGSLCDTINYATIYSEIEAIMQTPSQLLEHVVGRIIEKLQQQFPQIEGGHIALYKENPPITGRIDRVGVIVDW